MNFPHRDVSALSTQLAPRAADPVSRSGKATGRGAFEAQSAQTMSAAYYFDLAARDYILADGAIELIIEGVPCSAFIESPQSSELIFCGQSVRLRGGKHAGRWWQIPARFARTEPARDALQLFHTRYLRVGDQLWCGFSESNVVAHFLDSGSEGLDLLLHLRDRP